MIRIYVFVILLYPVLSFASGSDIIGFGARNIGMGNTGVASSSDSSAVFYNPALLTECGNHIMLGTTLTDMYIDIVPFEGSSGERYDDVINMYGLYISGRHNLKFDKFAFGFGIYLPTNRVHLEKSYFPDERERYFSNKIHPELLGTRSEGESIYISAAYRVFKDLSIGGGAILKINSDAPSYQYLPSIIDTSSMYLNLAGEEKIKLFPVAGIVYRPFESLRIGFSYRSETGFKIVSTSYTEVRGLTKPGEPNVSKEVFYFQYTPSEYSGAISYRIKDLLFVLDIVYEEYSNYRDSHYQRPTVPFWDIVSTHLGIEYTLNERILLRSGYVFHPSPVPEQDGRTNYADTTVHYFNFGGGSNWKYEDWRLVLDIYVQIISFVYRENVKSTEAKDPVVDEDKYLEGLQSKNPGYPGFSIDGFGYGGGISVSIFY